MSDDPFNVPPVPEQDEVGAGGDALPTYDDLTTQHGPNSRFGRWREWIEKRAAERYAETSPADVERRRQRGWGEGVDQQPQPQSALQSQPPVAFPPTMSVYAPSTHSSMYTSSYGTSSHPVSMYSSAPSSFNFGTHLHPQLHLQTSFATLPVSPLTHAKYPPPPTSLIPESIPPSHLKLYNFGSRFLPHATSPIRCLLPLSNHHLLLIGHDNGLSVLNMYPGETDEDDDAEKGPIDAEAKLIWEGEGVHQMSILESESTGEGTPQGVVLALVSTESDSSKEQESPRILRMYNLASLVSLAKWASTQKDAKPLDLRGGQKSKGSNGKKHHRPPSSITKGLKNLVLDGGIAQPTSPSRRHEPQASYSSLTSTWTSPGRSRPAAPTRADSVDSEWDMINELPLRWATNYTPLASAGSRLQHNSVLVYDVWKNEGQRGPGGVLLAIATKSSILLYEAPKGERAFRFTKEFYTPLHAKSITFIHQSVQDNVSRSPSDVLPRSSTVDSLTPRHTRGFSFNANIKAYPTQLSLFVVFEKKAGTIRVADAAVGEVELYEDNWSAQQNALMATPSTSSLTSRRSRASWDGRGFTKEKGSWARPVKFDIPGPTGKSTVTQMCLLTRGRQSHIIPHPLPAKVSAVPPYRIFYWTSAPTSVTVRVCHSDIPEEPPFLQAVAFSDEGVEVQEVSLSQLSERKGKGRAQDPIRAQADVGGAAGLLMVGGHWDRPFFPGLSRSYSTSSFNSYASSTLEDESGLPSRCRGEGIYGWVQKGAEDWRVVWLGDASSEDDGGFDEE
ncbi:hypothetical protein K466DRAFT_593748 [Polyporus arcularius HHB13444]|uniref:Uncharacterized protein n=1 Tax=Polyporus arcularius HHB13444 TaxID=1314778 RepID=A0A5C3PZJ4_9APHY|nr:hypothetical protein K466DRAFT_593748 [Polyporus arcularius HHB13444]